jgi:uncharacterized protein (DUF2147 family)
MNPLIAQLLTARIGRLALPKNLTRAAALAADLPHSGFPMFAIPSKLLTFACALGLTGALVLNVSRPAGAADAAPYGTWLTQAGDARVQVSRCGANLCGKVVWLKEPIDPATHKLQVDDKDRNPALRNRPIVGLQLFIGMKPTGPNAWSGQIYNADDGQTYASTVAVADPNRLEVRGCVGPICGSETWSKVAR